MMNYKPFRIRDGWFCIVDRKMYGPWELKAYAEAGYDTEIKRAIKRKQDQKDRIKDDQQDNDII